MGRHGLLTMGRRVDRTQNDPTGFNERKTDLIGKNAFSCGTTPARARCAAAKPE
jgi:hypothetical protein